MGTAELFAVFHNKALKQQRQHEQCREYAEAFEHERKIFTYLRDKLSHGYVPPKLKNHPKENIFQATQ